MVSAIESWLRKVGEMDDTTVNREVIRKVIASFGFPEERVDKAITCLLGVQTPGNCCDSIERVLSFKETCKVLSISKSGLRRLVNAGEITPIRLSQRRIGFSTQEINAFVAHKAA
jgi:predicted DNA-binding transcriptional regulator AlpA